MQVNIKEASRLAGISRTNFYKNYIHTGKISISKDERDRPQVDTSELLRVFGRLHGEITGLHDEKAQDDTQKHTEEHTPAPPDLSAQLAHLQVENDQLKERLNETRERLEEAKDRDGWQRGQIERLTDTIKLLEAPKKTTTARGWFERLMGRS
jgi:chromosome segregation ATPase